MRFSILILLFTVVVSSAPAIAETQASPEPTILAPATNAGLVSVLGRETYAVDILLYSADELISETSVALIEGYDAVIGQRKTHMEDHGKEFAVPTLYLSSMVVLKAGPEADEPGLGATRRIVDDALAQAEMLRVGPVNLWIYDIRADSYVVRVRHIAKAGADVQADELIAEDQGCLPCMEPLSPEELPLDAAIVGSNWWLEGSD